MPQFDNVDINQYGSNYAPGVNPGSGTNNQSQQNQTEGTPWYFDDEFGNFEGSPPITEQMLDRVYGSYFNRQSDLYSDFQNQLSTTLQNQFSPNSLLAVAAGMGVSGQGSAAIANEQRQQMSNRASKTAVNATNQFYNQMQQQGDSLINSAMQGNLSKAQMATQRQNARGNRTGFGESLLNMGAGLAGSFVGGPGGGMLAGGLMNWLQGGGTSNQASIGYGNVNTGDPGFDPNQGIFSY